MNVTDIIQKYQKHRWLAAILFLLIIIAGYFVTQKILGPKVATEVVTVEDIVQTIVASGHVEAPQRVNIGSQITGTVAAIPVAEGQLVKAQQLLITLEDSEAKALVAQAKASVAQALARIKQIRELGLPAAEQALKQSQLNRANIAKQHTRTKELHAKGFVGQSALDDAQKNLDVAESQVRAAQLQVESNSSQGGDYALAKSALAQAEAGLSTAIAKLGYNTIEAPVDGTLIARNVERGDVVQPGKVLMVLSPNGPTQLVVQIDERNMSNLKLGEKAIAAADAFPNVRFSAEIAYINPAVDALRGSVEVKLNVPSPPAHLRQDMTVSIDIEVARRAKARVLAADAIHDAVSTTPWVMKIESGHAKQQRVQLGIRGSGSNGGKVEILEGLQAGDQVIKATGAAAIEGAPIRALPGTTNDKNRI